LKKLGTDKQGRLLDRLEPSGISARFYQDLKEAGEAVDFGVFAAI
jgi:hypothetical protein